jgi:hypothetical protein
MNKGKRYKRQKTLLVVAIMIGIALLHFVTGSQYRGPFPLFVNGYLIDLLLPFGFYFLLCLNDNIILESWLAKGALIFCAAFCVEMAQYRGLPLFGSTYDPWDIAMYALGVVLAVLCDRYLFARLFSFWNPGLKPPRPDAKGEEDGMFSWRQN